jgi:LPXTG-site transpeptidase (sortase) family protein
VKLQVKSPRNMKRRISPSQVVLGIALVVLGLILVFGRNRIASNLSNDTFASEPVEIQGFSVDEVDETSLPKQIIISSLGIDLAVKQAKVVDGYWEVFSDSAGWGEGSGIPGEAGNQVIFAHARDGLFLPLRRVEKGMKVYVLVEDTWYSYEVTEVKEVYPNDTEVIKPTEDERLTLYTCSGFTDSKRLIVSAKRI